MVAIYVHIHILHNIYIYIYIYIKPTFQKGKALKGLWHGAGAWLKSLGSCLRLLVVVVLCQEIRVQFGMCAQVRGLRVFEADHPDFGSCSLAI